MKKTLLTFLLIIFPLFTVFPSTFTNTLDFGASVFSINDEGSILADQMFDVGYRLVYSPKDFGFYWGGNLTFGIPVMTMAASYNSFIGDVSAVFSFDSGSDFFMSFKIPFGYRWEESFIKNMGFYLGGGPALQLNFRNNVYTAVSVFGELGFQTNKTADIGFHMGWQFSISPLVFYEHSGYLEEIYSVESTIQAGMSWRRMKK